MTGEGAVQFLVVDGSGPGGGEMRRIAWRGVEPVSPGAPGLLWLSGFKSDMASTKAVAVAEYAAAHGLGATLFDYSGHGRSTGRFEDGTIGQWLDETEAVFGRVTTGPQVVIGSSMGGNIALLLARRLRGADGKAAARLSALVLVAPAWDMTERLIWPGMPAAAQRDIMEKGVAYRPSEYGEPYPITRRLIEDGRRHLIDGAPFDPGVPVFILQGAKDPDVPLSHVEKLRAILLGARVEMDVVPDGEHRLSRPEDLARLFHLVGRAVEVARG